MVSSGESVEIAKSPEEFSNTENGSSSDNEHDKIEKLKAENSLQSSEESLAEKTNGFSNGDHQEENGEKAQDEPAEQTDGSSVAENALSENGEAVQNGESVAAEPVAESSPAQNEEGGENSQSSSSADSSSPARENLENLENHEEASSTSVSQNSDDAESSPNAEIEETSKDSAPMEAMEVDAAVVAESKSEDDIAPKLEVEAKAEETEVLTIDDDDEEEDDDEITILDEEPAAPKQAEKMEVIEEVATTSKANLTVENGIGKAANVNEEASGKGVKRDVECIELGDDDDEEDIKLEPPAKKTKNDSEEQSENSSNGDKKPLKKEPELTSSDKLLEKLQQYVDDAIDSNNTINRKVLDALLGGINIQVQREPLSVRKLILEKQLVLPNTISFPPSMVVDLLIEHDPDFPISKVLNKMFGEERPKIGEAEKKEKQTLKAIVPAPAMTKFLMDIGQDMVQESTYNDIVHAKNLPEVPKNFDTYKQVAQQLKPVWETLKKRNEPYKLKLKRCTICDFQTESSLALSTHKATLHQRGSKFQCAMCKEIEPTEAKMIEHYFNAHLVVAKAEEKESKYPCIICDENFNFKGVREQHWKTCKKDYIRARQTMVPRQPDDILHINRWLWDKPAVDPTILQQQQNASAVQAKKAAAAQQQAAIQAQNHLIALRQQQKLAIQNAALQQQQLQQQAQKQQQMQMRQMAQLISRSAAMGSHSLISAMQQQLARQKGGSAALQQNAAVATQLQKQIQQAAAAAAAAGAGAGASSSSSTGKIGTSTAMQAAIAQMKANNQKNMAAKLASKSPMQRTSAAAASPSNPASVQQCEICDTTVPDKDRYLMHLQSLHKQMSGKTMTEMNQGAPLACSRCRDRFWTYEGLERHLVMSHGLVTADLLQKAQKKEDGGRCKLCGKQYAFNMLQHLVADHQVKLCSAEIMYSCDVCAFKCTSYQTLEAHLTSNHPKGNVQKKTPAPSDCITLDD